MRGSRIAGAMLVAAKSHQGDGRSSWLIHLRELVKKFPADRYC